jgi:hypothetical protein
MIFNNFSFNAQRVAAAAASVTVPNPILFLDAGNAASYTGSIPTTWTDTVGGKVFTLTGTSGTPTYNASLGTANYGSINFNAANAQYGFNNTGFGAGFTNWSIQAWYYYDGTTSGNANEGDIFTDQFGNSNINYVLGGAGANSTVSNNIAAGYYNGSWQSTSGTYVLPTLNRWYQVVATCSGSGPYILSTYVNGAANNSNSIASAPGGSNAGSRIMKNFSTDTRGGNLSIVKLYNVALSNAQVLAEYNTNKSKFGLT